MNTHGSSRRNTACTVRLARVGRRLRAGLADWIEARGTHQRQTTRA
jgi:hypothetical protein